MVAIFATYRLWGGGPNSESVDLTCGQGVMDGADGGHDAIAAISNTLPSWYPDTTSTLPVALIPAPTPKPT